MAQTKLKVNKVIRFIKKIQIFFLLFVLLFAVQPSHASSSYVLPYPSRMPGNIFYKIHLAEEKILQYWYFGDFGQFNYNLKESDKYLVEAKTLFEYNQYLLGFNAIKKSDYYFKQTLPYLLKARGEGKDISENKGVLRQAAGKHQEVLLKMEQEVPEVFTWSPEKSLPTKLNLKDAIIEAIKIREEYL